MNGPINFWDFEMYYRYLVPVEETYVESNTFSYQPSYRYGFQGQERDDEMKGIGNSYSFTFRIHDPRLGKFLSIDPLAREYPFYSPYAFSGNRVIDMVELEGLEPWSYLDKMDYNPQGSAASTFMTNSVISAANGFIGAANILYTEFSNPGTISGTDIMLSMDESLRYTVNDADWNSADFMEDVAGSAMTMGASKYFSKARSLTKKVDQNSVALDLKYKANWNEAQRAAADQKVDILNKSDLTVTKNVSRAGDQRNVFKKAGFGVDAMEDVDHVQDLQLGGMDMLYNFDNLDRSVNRSLGTQIQKFLNNLDDGTKIDKVTISDPD